MNERHAMLEAKEPNIANNELSNENSTISHGRKNTLFFESIQQQVTTIERYERSEEADSIVTEHFNSMVKTHTELVAKGEPIYVYTGKNAYTFLINGIKLDSTVILDEKTANLEEDAPPFKVLDIGAGDFSFNKFNEERYQGKVLTYGIAADDSLRHPNDRNMDEFHVFSNAEYLCQVYGENKFNLALSCVTFIHFVDTVAALIDTYKTLKSNGVLIIDKLTLPGVKNYAPYIILYLKQQGYRITAGNCIGEITNLIIQKTDDKPELNFPVHFDRVKSKKKVVYKPTDSLVAFIKEIDGNKVNNLAYNEGCKIVNDKIGKKIDSDLLERCPDLATLFAETQYQKLKLELQYWCILAVVAKSVDYDSLNELIETCTTEDERANIDQFSFIRDIIIRSDRPHLLYLSTDVEFRHYEKSENFPQQLRIVKIAAMIDIMRLGLREETKNTLSEMKLPYQEFNFFKNYPKHENFLLFPKLANENELACTLSKVRM